MLAELAQSGEPWIRSTGLRGLAQVQAMDDIDLLQDARGSVRRDRARRADELED